MFKTCLLILMLPLSFLLLQCSSDIEYGIQEQGSLTGPDFSGKKLFRAWAANHLEDPDVMLSESRFDVAHMDHIFKGAWGGSYLSKVLVHENEATRSAILNMIRDAQASLTNHDMYIQYSSSHGVVQGLIPYPENDAAKLISYEELRDEIQKIPAKEVLIFLMACHSGGLIDAFKRLDQAALKEHWKGRTLFIMTSSTLKEKSQAGPIFDPQEPIHVEGSAGSRFGHFLWKALIGEADKADRGNKDGLVSLEELVSYVKDNVRPQHNPQVFGFFDPSLVMTSQVPPLEVVQDQVLHDELQELNKKYSDAKEKINNINEYSKKLFEIRTKIIDALKKYVYNSEYSAWFKGIESAINQKWDEQWDAFEQYTQVAMENNCDVSELEFPDNSTAFDRLIYSTECDEDDQKILHDKAEEYSESIEWVQILMDVELTLIKIVAPHYVMQIEYINKLIKDAGPMRRTLLDNLDDINSQLYDLGIKLLDDRVNSQAQ